MKFLFGKKGLFSSLIQEIKEVTWPTYKQTAKYCLSVVLFIAILVVFYLLVTALWTAILRLLVG